MTETILRLHPPPEPDAGRRARLASRPWRAHLRGMSDQTIAKSFRVTGRVQGVSFRAWTQAQAEARGLEGWVRNTPEGAVEGVVQGPVDAVDDFVARLRSGPPLARVDDVHMEDRTPETLADFEVRP